VTALRLRVGDVVEVKSKEEILATLDARGALDGLPFMPEMLDFCGRQFTVRQRADKTCDTATHTGMRRMMDAVHLEGTRCPGSSHGGCDAGCELFWKEAWLRRVGTASNGTAPPAGSGCSEAALIAATRRDDASEEILYRCQATELPRATTPLSPWDVRQYVRDVRAGNVRVPALLKAIAWTAFRWCIDHLPGFRIQLRVFNAIQRLRGGKQYHPLGGEQANTPTEKLDLAPGELVEVKGVEEIRKTLNPTQRNRGLYFDLEMTPYCGQKLRVRSRVRRIIEEGTGRMVELPGSSVILEGGFCTGRYHKYCPRAIYPFWREIWLRRVTEEPPQ
jgi:hypothetical protein